MRDPGALPLRASAICWPSVFMNSEALATLVVPKSAYCWPLIASNASGPWIELSPAMAPSTVAKSPVALLKLASSAAPTARWLTVLPPNEKAFDPRLRVRNTLLGS